MKNPTTVLAVLYGKGGLGDVGRHAVLAALERDDVASVKVLSEHPETLNETNWKCGCPGGHYLTSEQQKRLDMIHVQNNWKDISGHFQGVTSIVSCLGTRQPFLMGSRCATAGSKAILNAMKAHDITRVVSITSMGLGDDYPCMEFHFAGKVMDVLFKTLSRRQANDLVGSEKTYKESNVDYLLVRPVGLAEDAVPTGEWFVQKKKYEDIVATNIAKMDCGRFMVEEAIHPTRHRTAVVVGGDPEKDEQLTEILEQQRAQAQEGAKAS